MEIQPSDHNHLPTLSINSPSLFGRAPLIFLVHRWNHLLNVHQSHGLFLGIEVMVFPLRLEALGPSNRSLKFQAKWHSCLHLNNQCRGRMSLLSLPGIFWRQFPSCLLFAICHPLNVFCLLWMCHRSWPQHLFPLEWLTTLLIFPAFSSNHYLSTPSYKHDIL